MKTYLFNLTFHIKEELENVVMTWINDVFAPVIYDPEVGFDKFETFKIITPMEDDYSILCVQVRSKNRDYLMNWFESVAYTPCNELYKKYEKADQTSDVTIFPSLMESIG